MRSTLGWGMVLVALALALHAPWCSDSFGARETNGGIHFGIAAKNYETFGFAEVRGVPHVMLRPDRSLDAVPYLNHPPGLFWVMAAGGTREFAIRAPIVAAAILAVLAFLLVLRDRIGLRGAVVASIALVVSPALVQLSYESSVLACALWLVHATTRLAVATGRERAGWRVVQITAAAAGPWFDWSFALWCVALVPFVAPPLRDGARRLAVPGIATLVSVVGVLVWRVWAAGAPAVRVDLMPAGIETLVETTILNWPSTGEFLRAAWHMLSWIAGPALVVVGLLGSLRLARIAPRIAVAFAIAGVAHPLLFADHALDHGFFWTYLVVFAAAGLGALTERERERERSLLALVVVTLLATLVHGIVVAHANRTTFYRDLGAALTTATRVDGDATARRPVATNFPGQFPYYADSSWIFLPAMTDVAHLEAARRQPRFRDGIAFVCLRYAVGSDPGAPSPDAAAALESFLAPLAKRRLPQLEVDLRGFGSVFELVVHEAWLVTIPAVQ
jgi:hypothetical protein